MAMLGDTSPLLNELFKRNCISCENVPTPPCPPCSDGQVCIQRPQTCTQCTKNICVAQQDSGAVINNNPSSGPNIGAIVGGVVGGVAVVSIIVFCVWKFLLKGRRHEIVEGDWDDADEYPMEKPGMTDFQRDARSRASTHTVTSMASTVLTRASNIIQIAYIPGVTNRQQAQTDPSILVPPVPPIPIPTAPNSPYTTNEQHFFVPDIRDSTFSGVSAFDPSRQSVASSLARASFATTVYHHPPTPVVKAKPSVVSVKSGLNSPSGSNMGTPPVPLVETSKFEKSSLSGSIKNNSTRPVLVQIPSSNDRGAGASPMGSIRSMKPTQVTLVKRGNSLKSSPSLSGKTITGESSSSPKSANSGKGEKQGPVGLGLHPLTEASIPESLESPDSRHRLAAQDGFSSDEEDDVDVHERSRQSLLKKTHETSPFDDNAGEDEKKQESPKKSASSECPDKTRNRSPFEDENEA